jgi:hypothetical protein
LSGYKSERIFAPDFCILVPEIVARRKHFDYAIGLDGSNYQMFLLVRVLWLFSQFGGLQAGGGTMNHRRTHLALQEESESITFVCFFDKK